MAKKLALDVGPARHEIELSETADGAFTMLVNDVPHTVALERINASNLHRLTIDGHGMDIVIARRGGGLTVAVGPASHQVSILRAGARRPFSSPGLTEGELAVHAPSTAPSSNSSSPPATASPRTTPSSSSSP